MEPATLPEVKNPYAKQPHLHTISTVVSLDDYSYLRALFPSRSGILNRVLGNLFYALACELRARGLDPRNESDPAWSVDHPTLVLLSELLSRTNFGPRPGGTAGHSGSRNDGRTASRVGEALCDSAFIGSNTESLAQSRGWGDEGEESETFQSEEE